MLDSAGSCGELSTPFIILGIEASKDVQENVFDVEENGSFVRSVEI